MVETPPYEVPVNTATWEAINTIASQTQPIGVQPSHRTNDSNLVNAHVTNNFHNNNNANTNRLGNLESKPQASMDAARISVALPSYISNRNDQVDQHPPAVMNGSVDANNAVIPNMQGTGGVGTQPAESTTQSKNSSPPLSPEIIPRSSELRTTVADAATNSVMLQQDTTQARSAGDQADPVRTVLRGAQYDNPGAFASAPMIEKGVSSASINMNRGTSNISTGHSGVPAHNRISTSYSGNSGFPGNPATAQSNNAAAGIVQYNTSQQQVHMSNGKVSPGSHSYSQPINSSWNRYTNNAQQNTTNTPTTAKSYQQQEQRQQQQHNVPQNRYMNSAQQSMLSGGRGVTKTVEAIPSVSSAGAKSPGAAVTDPQVVPPMSATLPLSMNRPRVIGKGSGPIKARMSTSGMPNGRAIGTRPPGPYTNHTHQAKNIRPHPRVLGPPFGIRPDKPGSNRVEPGLNGRGGLSEPPRPVALDRSLASNVGYNAQAFTSRVNHAPMSSNVSNSGNYAPSNAMNTLHASAHYNGNIRPGMPRSMLNQGTTSTNDATSGFLGSTQHAGRSQNATHVNNNLQGQPMHNGTSQKQVKVERGISDEDATVASKGKQRAEGPSATINIDIDTNMDMQRILNDNTAANKQRSVSADANVNATGYSTADPRRMPGSAYFASTQEDTNTNHTSLAAQFSGNTGASTSTSTSARDPNSSLVGTASIPPANNTHAPLNANPTSRNTTPIPDDVAGIHNTAEYTARVWNRVAGRPATDEQIARAGLVQVQDGSTQASVTPTAGLIGPTRLQVYAELKRIEGIEGLGLDLGPNGMAYSQSASAEEVSATIPEVYVQTVHNGGNPKQLPLMPRQNSEVLAQHAKTGQVDHKKLEKLPAYDEETALYLLISAQKLAGTPWYGTVEEMSKLMETKGTLPHRYDINFNVRQYTAQEYIWRHAHDPEVSMKSLMQRISRTPNTPAVIVRKSDTHKKGRKPAQTSDTLTSVPAPQTTNKGFRRLGRVLHHGSHVGSSRSVRNLRWRESFKAYNRCDLQRSSKYSEHSARWKVFGHTQTIFCCLYDRTGTRVITAADDGNIKIWCAITGSLLRTLRGHSREVVDLAISSDNTTLVSACRDKVTVIWDMVKGDQLQVIHNPGGKELHNVFVSASPYPDNQYVVTIGADGTARFYKNMLEGDKNQYLLRAQFGEKVTMKDHLTAGDSSSGGSFFAVGSTLGESYIYHLQRGCDPVKLDELPGHKNKIGTLKFSTRGCRFVTGSLDGTARVWDMRDGVWISNVLDVTAHLVCNPIGTPFATDPKTFGRKILDEANNKRAKDYMATLKPSQLLDYQQVSMVCFNCDDTMVITAVGDCTLKIWNPNTKDHIHTLVGHANVIYVLEPHPTDPSVVMSGGHDGRLILWDIIEGTCLKMIWNHDPHQSLTHGITDGRFSPDGDCITITDAYGNVSVIAPEIRGKKVEAKEQQFDERDSRVDYPVTVVNGVVMDRVLNVPIMACPDRRVCSLAGIPYADQLTEEEYCNYWPVQTRAVLTQYMANGIELAKAEETNLKYQLSKRTKDRTKIMTQSQKEQERALAASRAKIKAYKKEANRKRKKEQEKVSASTQVILTTSANERLAANARPAPMDRSGRSPGPTSRRRTGTVYIDADEETIDVDAAENAEKTTSSDDAYHITSSEDSETEASSTESESDFSEELSDVEYPKQRQTRKRGRKSATSKGKRKAKNRTSAKNGASSKGRTSSKNSVRAQGNGKGKKRLSRGTTSRGRSARDSESSEDDSQLSSDNHSEGGSGSDFGVITQRGSKRASSSRSRKTRPQSRNHASSSRSRSKRRLVASDSESGDDSQHVENSDSHPQRGTRTATNHTVDADDSYTGVASTQEGVLDLSDTPAKHTRRRDQARADNKRPRSESVVVDVDIEVENEVGLVHQAQVDPEEVGVAEGRPSRKRARTRYDSQHNMTDGSDTEAQSTRRASTSNKRSKNSESSSINRTGAGTASGRAAAGRINYQEQPSGAEDESESDVSSDDTHKPDSKNTKKYRSNGTNGKGKQARTPQKTGRQRRGESVVEDVDASIPTPDGIRHTRKTSAPAHDGKNPSGKIKTVKAVLKGTPRTRDRHSAAQPYDRTHRGSRKSESATVGVGVQPEPSSKWWNKMPLRAAVAIQPVLWNCLDARKFFGEAVNADEIPDYYQIIQQPMDLGTIKQNIDEGVYIDRASDYIRDVCLVYSNAQHYNAEDSDIYKAAKHLESVFTAHLGVLWDHHEDYIELGATDNIHANEFSTTLSDTPLSPRALEQLGLLHAELITTPHTAVHFSRPVFETLRLPEVPAKELQKYMRQIAKPMDLHNLGICIAEGMVKNLQQYASLMELSISNCVSYNLESSNIVEQAQLLQICYRERLKQVERAMEGCSAPKVPVQLADIRKLHNSIMNSDHAPMFNAAVPDHVQGYYEKITEPMDFGSIKDALNSSSVCMTMNEYMSDCTLVFTNCFLFNELDSPICVTCQSLRDAWLAKCNSLLYGRSASRRRKQ